MALFSFGFTGTVDQVAEAQRLANLGPRFRVGSLGSMAVSVSVGANRTVNIAAGNGQACGLGIVNDAQVSVAFAPNTGGVDRYDALVLRINWATGTTVPTVISGTSAPPLINGSGTVVDLTKINRIPGVLYDALMAVQRVTPGVGLFSSGDLSDCRMWGGYEGFAITGDSRHLDMLDTFPGSMVMSSATNIVWNRLAGGLWGFHKWIGTDKNTQPMLSTLATAFPVPQFVTTAFPLSNIVDHSGGLLSATTGVGVVCNNYGRVRVEVHAFSDGGARGSSWVNMPFPAGGGNHLAGLSDMRTRDAGYSSAGTLRQSITTGPVQVAPGDVFAPTVIQGNESVSTLNYDLYLTVTYV